MRTGENHCERKRKRLRSACAKRKKFLHGGSGRIGKLLEHVRIILRRKHKVELLMKGHAATEFFLSHQGLPLQNRFVNGTS